MPLPVDRGGVSNRSLAAKEYYTRGAGSPLLSRVFLEAIDDRDFGGASLISRDVKRASARELSIQAAQFAASQVRETRSDHPPRRAGRMK